LLQIKTLKNLAAFLVGYIKVPALAQARVFCSLVDMHASDRRHLLNKKPSCRLDSRPYWLSVTFKVI